MTYLLTLAPIRATALLLVAGIALALGFSACKNATDVDANRVVNAIATESVATLVSIDSLNTASNCPIGTTIPHTVIISNISPTQKVTVKSVALEFGNRGITLGTMPAMPITLDVSTTSATTVGIPVTIRPSQAGTFQENIIINGDVSKKFSIRYSTQGTTTSDTIGVGSGDLEVINVGGTNTSRVEFEITDPTGTNFVTRKIRLRNVNATKTMRISGMEIENTNFNRNIQLRYENMIISKPPFPEVLAPNESITLNMVYSAPTTYKQNTSEETKYRFYTRSSDSAQNVTGVSNWNDLKMNIYITNNANKNVYVDQMDSMITVKPGTVSQVRFRVRNLSDEPAVFTTIGMEKTTDLLSANFVLLSNATTTIMTTPYTIPAGETITVTYNCSFKVPQAMKETEIPLTPVITVTGSGTKLIAPSSIKLQLNP